MTTGECSCLISFTWAPLTCSERGGRRKIQNENICSNPAGNIYFHFEIFAPSPFRTGQRNRCKWNQPCPFAWSHSCVRPQIRLIIQGFVYSYLQYSFNSNFWWVSNVAVRMWLSKWASIYIYPCVRLSHSVLWVPHRHQFLSNRFHTSHASIYDCRRTRLKFVTKSMPTLALYNVPVKPHAIKIIPCEKITNYIFCRVTFKLHMQIV